MCKDHFFLDIHNNAQCSDKGKIHFMLKNVRVFIFSHKKEICVFVNLSNIHSLSFSHKKGEKKDEEKYFTPQWKTFTLIKMERKGVTRKNWGKSKSFQFPINKQNSPNKHVFYMYNLFIATFHKFASCIQYSGVYKEDMQLYSVR